MEPIEKCIFATKLIYFNKRPKKLKMGTSWVPYNMNNMLTYKSQKHREPYETI